MARKQLIENLSSQVPIANPDGTPTPQFMRVIQKLAITGALSKDTAGAIQVGSGAVTLAMIQNIADKMILANNAGVSGPPLALTMSQILDFLGVTRGSIIYRGASGWTLLPPGTANNVLQTNGPGADPTWVTPASGGSGINTLGRPDLSVTQTPGVNFYIMKMIIADNAFTISKIAFAMATASATSKLQVFVYASAADGTPGALLGSSLQQTGVVAGYNEIALSSTVAVTKGQIFWVGASVITAALTNMWAQSGGVAAFVANGSSTVPAGTCPAVTKTTTANSIYAFWAVA